MARRTGAEIDSDLNRLMPDNTSREISPADSRENIRNVKDSVVQLVEEQTGDNRLDAGALKNRGHLLPEPGTGDARKVVSVNQTEDDYELVTQSVIAGPPGPPGQQGIQGVAGRSLNPQGPWVLSAAYALSDTVVSNGDGYQCILAHTSDVTNQPGQGADWDTYWEQYVERGEQGPVGPPGEGVPGSSLNPRGSWNAGNDYAILDVVAFDSKSWIATTTHTANIANQPALTGIGAQNWMLNSDRGEQGLRGFRARERVPVYRNAASAPSTPHATAYDFLTNLFSGLTPPWTVTVPSAVSGQQVYVSFVLIDPADNSFSSFSTPTLAGNEGPAGPPGPVGPAGPGLNPRGRWAASIAYTALDIVDNDGSSYIARINHTSSAAREPGVGSSWNTYWFLNAEKGDTGARGSQGTPGRDGEALTPRGAWALNTAYTIRNLVTRSGSSFVCIQAHTSNTGNAPITGASRATYWMTSAEKGDAGAQGIQGTPGAAGMNGAPGAPGRDGTNGTDGRSLDPSGAWSSSASYEEGDVVSNNGSSYIALSNHTANVNREPGTTSGNVYWMLNAEKGATGDAASLAAARVFEIGRPGSIPGNLFTTTFTLTFLPAEPVALSAIDRITIYATADWQATTEAVARTVSWTIPIAEAVSSDGMSLARTSFVTGAAGRQQNLIQMGITSATVASNGNVTSMIARIANAHGAEIVTSGFITLNGVFGITKGGAQGAAGATGAKGDQGDQGPKGDQGDRGAQGLRGDRGPTGATGAQGPKGDQGEPGARGATGPQGGEGPQGERGLQGDRGPTGPTGAKGDQGDQGPKGDQGDRGPTGEGVPAGGTTGQVLTKVDATNFNTQWSDPTGGSGGDVFETVDLGTQRGGREWTATGESTEASTIGNYALIPVFPGDRLRITSGGGTSVSEESMRIPGIVLYSGATASASSFVASFLHGPISGGWTNLIVDIPENGADTSLPDASQGTASYSNLTDRVPAYVGFNAPAAGQGHPAPVFQVERMIRPLVTDLSDIPGKLGGARQALLVNQSRLGMEFASTYVGEWSAGLYAEGTAVSHEGSLYTRAGFDKDNTTTAPGGTSSTTAVNQSLTRVDDRGYSGNLAAVFGTPATDVLYARVTPGETYVITASAARTAFFTEIPATGVSPAVDGPGDGTDLANAEVVAPFISGTPYIGIFARAGTTPTLTLGKTETSMPWIQRVKGSPTRSEIPITVTRTTDQLGLVLTLASGSTLADLSSIQLALYFGSTVIAAEQQYQMFSLPIRILLMAANSGASQAPWQQYFIPGEAGGPGSVWVRALAQPTGTSTSISIGVFFGSGISAIPAQQTLASINTRNFYAVGIPL